MRSVNYAQMTPILAEAIKELNKKVEDLKHVPLPADDSILTRLAGWFGDAGNDIGDFFAKKVPHQRSPASRGRTAAKAA
ncbi:MAG: hypothetical protein WDN09_02655 [bacterium]